MAADFFGMRRPAKGDHLVFGEPRHVREQHFAHQLVRTFENALGGTDNNRLLALGRGPLAQILGDTAHELGRHHDKHHLAAFEGGVHVGRVLEIRRKNHAGEFVLVLMFCRKQVHFGLRIRPERNVILVLVFRRKQVYFGLRVCPEGHVTLVFIHHLTKSQAPSTCT